MSWIETYDKLVVIEKELNIYNMVVQNVHFWERVRFQVFSSIIRKPSFQEQSEIRKQGKKSRIRRLISSIVNLSKNPFRAPQSSILLVCTARRKLQDGLWWDIYSDYLIDNIEDDYLALEAHFNNRHYTPAKTENLRYLDYLEMIAYLKKIFKRVEIRISDDEINKLMHIKERLDSVFGISINLVSIVRRMLQDRETRLPQYLKLLEKIKPRVVILVQGYGREDFIEACRISEIPTIELQHGVISPYHVGYSFSGAKKENFADYLFVWGDYWKDVASYPVDKRQVLSIGFPYLEEQKKSFDQSKKKDQILFISQDVIGEELSKFAVEMSSNPSLKYSIKYKLHPQEISGWKEKYPWLLETNIKVVDGFDASLYELFSESKILVGVGSTALYEGLAFGLQIYIANVTGSDIMDALIATGSVEKATNPDYLVKRIAEGLGQNTSTFNVEHFFKSNSISNMIETINDIIRNSDSKDVDNIESENE